MDWNKKIKISYLLLAVAILTVVILFLSFWLADIKAQKIITGQAFIDSSYGGSAEALDGWDIPAEGLRVQLLKEVAQGARVVVDETTVNQGGEYRFVVTETGIYEIRGVSKILGYPGWDRIIYLQYPTVEIKEGGTSLTPTLLVIQYGYGKG